MECADHLLAGVGFNFDEATILIVECIALKQSLATTYNVGFTGPGHLLGHSFLLIADK